MRVLVLGGDGYLGWPTALRLSEAGHDVAILDSQVRRRYDVELGIHSLVPIADLDTRLTAWHEVSGRRISAYRGDLLDASFLHGVLRDFGPHAVVHFAEQSSAPYSMTDREHAVYTQYNNVVGTLNLIFAIADVDPEIHVVKLGTMGEYGTPDIDIEEGWLNIEHNGRSDRVLYPKRPGSFYHLSKVHDSHNLEFATRIWGLRVTDLNQGIVYGQQTDHTVLDERLATRLSYDAVFGTVLNRFVVEVAIGHPLTVYGSGGQTRGLIDIRDTTECIRLAVENPAAPGEFRVFNQVTEVMSIREIAATVSDRWPGESRIEFLDNPRVEAAEHYYNVRHTALIDLGLKPHLLSDTLLESMFDIVSAHRHAVDIAVLRPRVRWAEPTNPTGEDLRAFAHRMAATIPAP